VNQKRASEEESTNLSDESANKLGLMLSKQFLAGKIKPHTHHSVTMLRVRLLA